MSAIGGFSRHSTGPRLRLPLWRNGFLQTLSAIRSEKTPSGKQSGKEKGDSVFRVRNEAAPVRNKKAVLSARLFQRPRPRGYWAIGPRTVTR